MLSANDRYPIDEYYIRFINNCLFLGLTIVVVFLLDLDGIGNAQVRSPLYELPREPLTVTTVEDAHCSFQTVIVRDTIDRNRGLMHVRHLPTDQAMLFLHDREQLLSMWMKNTLIPLDMWFIDSSGAITYIARYAKPLSLDSIKSTTPVLAVLEVNAGLSDLLGVSVGARVTHPVFRRSH